MGLGAAALVPLVFIPLPPFLCLYRPTCSCCPASLLNPNPAKKLEPKENGEPHRAWKPRRASVPAGHSLIWVGEALPRGMSLPRERVDFARLALRSSHARRACPRPFWFRLRWISTRSSLFWIFEFPSFGFVLDFGFRISDFLPRFRIFPRPSLLPGFAVDESAGLDSLGAQPDLDRSGL
jgi:hypothetical protein